METLVVPYFKSCFTERSPGSLSSLKCSFSQDHSGDDAKEAKHNVIEKLSL